jgi:hypothetical protein
MMRSQSSTIVIITASLAVLGGMALAEQDRYTLKYRTGSRGLTSEDTKPGKTLQ